MAGYAQVDVSGDWSLSVTTDNGVTTPAWVLEQDGGVLTGLYRSATIGDQSLRGSVRGNEVTIELDADLQGQSIPLLYRGTVSDDGTMSGSIDVAGGMLTGTFTATRRPGRP